ncbi:MAG: hypothetical protein JO005_13725, partial [Gammaproteobacteria bacterium]|nr:hypothetical protein [Gammaproteobacteria bacterium]
VRCRFQPGWAAYYRDAQLPAAAAAQLVAGASATLAHCMPILLAFGLLHSARRLLEERPSDCRRVNRRRLARHRAPLLEHLEVRCGAAMGGERGRRPRPLPAPALPGSLVRGADELIWHRVPLRGRAGRAVRLSFEGGAR